MKVLLAEIDINLGEEIKSRLEYIGYYVTWIKRIEQVDHALKLDEYDAIIVDVSSAESDSSLLDAIRSENSETPLLMMTTQEKVDAGKMDINNICDGYIVKKFDLDEMSSRLRELVKTSSIDQKQSVILDVGEKTVMLNPVLRQVRFNGRTVELSRKEFIILSTLMENTGKVLSSVDLQKYLYDYNQDVDSNTIQVYVYNLRKKVDKNLIRTIHGVGYIIEEPD